jgi:biopolymer transport protein ExbD
MIDIVFNLLIFFLVGASFKVQEGLLPSKLPETAGLHAGIQIPLRPIRIRLNRTGDSLVSEDCDITVENLKQGVQPYNFAELHAILGGLKQRAAYSEETPVILIPEGSVKYGHVINAYNAASRAQFKSISFAAP